MTYFELDPNMIEIRAERRKQDAKWGEQNHPDGTGPHVVMAYGDAYAGDHAHRARAVCQSAAVAGRLTWRHILTEEVFEAFAEDDPTVLRAELIQIAAVAVAWIEAIDRRGQRPLPRDGRNLADYLVAEYFHDDGKITRLDSRERPELFALAGDLMIHGWEVRRVVPDSRGRDEEVK